MKWSGPFVDGRHVTWASVVLESIGMHRNVPDLSRAMQMMPAAGAWHASLVLGTDQMTVTFTLTSALWKSSIPSSSKSLQEASHAILRFVTLTHDVRR